MSTDVIERTWEDLSDLEKGHLRDHWWYVLKNDAGVEVSQRVPMKIDSEVMFVLRGKSTYVAAVMDDGTELEHVVDVLAHTGSGVQLVKE